MESRTWVTPLFKTNTQPSHASCCLFLEVTHSQDITLKLRSSQTRYHHVTIPPYWCWVKIHPTYQLPWGIQSRTCSHSTFNTLGGLSPSESHMFFKICLKWDKHLHLSLKAAASSLILKCKALPSSCWFGGGWHFPVNIQRHPHAQCCLWG